MRRPLEPSYNLRPDADPRQHERPCLTLSDVVCGAHLAPRLLLHATPESELERDRQRDPGNSDLGGVPSRWDRPAALQVPEVERERSDKGDARQPLGALLGEMSSIRCFADSAVGGSDCRCPKPCSNPTSRPRVRHRPTQYPRDGLPRWGRGQGFVLEMTVKGDCASVRQEIRVSARRGKSRFAGGSCRRRDSNPRHADYDARPEEGREGE
jgi:hypothetical protein